MVWEVHKFGGSTLVDASSIDLISQQFSDSRDHAAIVVVSALKGVTDLLQELIACSERQDDPIKLYQIILDKHSNIAMSLLDDDELNIYLSDMNGDLKTIEKLLAPLSEMHKLPSTSVDRILGFGEIWSANLIARFFKAALPKDKVTFLDARDFLITTQTEMGITPLWDESQQLLENIINKEDYSLVVVTGFIAKDEKGIQCTLGRNGSDYSASIIALLVNAHELTFWKDVDGVLSADPSVVPEGNIIEELSYNEAMELSYFGAKILHPKTMTPAIEKSIPIRIKNLFNSSFPGTTIMAKAHENERIVKGVTGIDNISLLTLSGAGMIGVPGTANRLFGSLREANISVLLISQGSSEHSICFAVASHHAELAKMALENEFKVELNSHLLSGVEVQDNCAIMAIVGDGMAGAHGVSGKFFSSLGMAGINVKAIAQGASERNISVVIDRHFLNKAIKAVHSSFYLSEKTISIGIIGVGNVGQALIDQLADQASTLNRDFNVNLKLRAIANSKSMCLKESIANSDVISLKNDSVDKEFSIDVFIEHLKADHIPHAVIIDCTASAEIASMYSDLLAKGIHVITANKIAHSGSITAYNQLVSDTRKQGFHFLYEATVGAGLPIIKSLKDIIETGDEVLEISGIFSGTLGYLFNKYNSNQSFSSVLAEAYEEGYTEPDPRDDLSGLDVARKVVILARECGHHIEVGDVKVQSLIPEAIKDVPLDSFMSKLDQLNDLIDPYLSKAESNNKKLRYAVKIDIENPSYEVSLQEFSHDHSFSNISLTDNIFQFKTKRYTSNPLIIIGPGAGPEVTAAGIFSDILRLSTMLAVYKLPVNIE